MRHRRLVMVSLGTALLLSGQPAGGRGAAPFEIDQRFQFSGLQSRAIQLTKGDTVEIAAGVESPSKLPANGRLAVEWNTPLSGAGFRKVLHALDPDIFLIYRAPATGSYALTLRVVEDEEPVFSGPRWRETGIVAEMKPFPRRTPWPAGLKVPVRVLVRPVDLGQATRGAILETEPNNSIQQSQAIPFTDGNSDQTIHVSGGADDIEYFDNGHYGDSGDDWYQIAFKGSEPRLLTCNLTLTDPFVTARLRFYTEDSSTGAHPEYNEGKNANETTHEQVEEHRTAIVRLLKPGGVYFLRVEANSPGYDLELRIRRPAPFTDVREAVRMGMYDHIAQVDAWLLNRPRGNSLDRRLRDTGSMYGTNCMSCHTQSGVWGPAVPIAFGYRVENAGSYRHLMNVMYESLRPTTTLKDAANNTSLPPHDLGDGPAGTRVAGHNVRTLEAVIPPRKLHSAQQIRTANYILQSADPTGINAAGKGSNVGQAVVFHYAGEILRTALDKTGEQRYLDGIVEKARKLLDLQPKFTDDLAHRILFFQRVFPSTDRRIKEGSEEMRKLVEQARSQLESDERTLRASQREDGAWGFTPGIVDPVADPAPTALAIDALVSLAASQTDPAAAKGVRALLALQDPYGRWNRAAKTGFVTTSYVLNTLARLYPDKPQLFTRKDFEPQPNESLQDSVARMRRLAQLDAWSVVSTDAPAEHLLDLMQAGATHRSPSVRYWAMIGLGARHNQNAVPALAQGLGDPVKMVREAARWGLRQTLLDDRGWEQLFQAQAKAGDLAREQLAAALVMRADAVMTRSQLDLERLAAMLDRMMNTDPNPAVRAWAARASWNWWLWNPPTRRRLNQAFLTLLETPEPSVLAENAKRYQLQALFIVNGNRASANYDQPYPELAELFEAIEKRIQKAPVGRQIGERVTGVAATYYNAAYGSNGTGQLGYATPHASEMVGKAVLGYWEAAEASGQERGVQLAIEAAANVIHEGVQKKLLHYAVKGPEALRPIASSSLSDPRAVLLPTSPEFVEPLMERVHRAAADEAGRSQAARTVIRQLSRARWDLPVSVERQRAFFDLLIPKLRDPADETQWFLAEQMGGVLAANPDLRTETLLTLAPKSFRNRLEELLWLPSAGWMLKIDTPIPEIGQQPWPQTRAELRRAALDRVVRNLSPDADRRLREAALRLMSQAELRSHPEVISAVAHVNAGEAGRLLPEAFDRELRETVERDATLPKLVSTPERSRNFAYFRDYVMPELNLENREDAQSCFTCHGSGRVPSMELKAPDRRTGFLAAADVWKNYRTLLERIDLTAVERSKLLVKPLNLQTGKEDGHQGGRRYKPGDRGHEILKRWAADVAGLK